MLNKTILMGRLGADPELKQTPSGVSVCSFGIAVERNFAGKNQERGVDWIDIVAWRQTAEFICKYFAKGDAIVIEGSIQTRSYEDRHGNKRKAVEVVASSVYFGGGKREDSHRNADVPPPTEPPQGYSSGQDRDFEVTGDSADLPF